MNLLLGGILLYVLAQLAIGLAVSRRIRTEDDYLLAGRRLGPVIALFTIFATWFGSETCIGAAGAVYARGLSGGSHDPFGYALCLLLMGTLFAAALWRRGYTTLVDLHRERYGVGIERLTVLIMIPPSLLWAAAQIRAFGQVLSSASGLDLPVAITVAAVVVVTYTATGGLLADAVTDLVQGIALVIGLAALLWAVLGEVGGAAAAAASVPPERLDPFGAGERGIFDLLEDWAVPILGSVTAQELASRVLASRSARVARNATIGASGIYLLVGLVPVALGLLGPRLLPGLEHPEQVLPLLAREYLSPVVYVLFAGALVSAILSTVDSNLLAVSGIVSHNVVLRLRPGLSERAKVGVARAGVVVSAGVAYALAFSSDAVYSLVADASAFGGAGLFVVMLAGLHSKRGGAWAAGSALVLGLVVQVTGTYLVEFPYPFLWSLAASAAAYSTVTLFARLRG